MIDDTGSDHTDIAAGAEREADDLKHQGDKLEKDIEATKTDWESKKEDARVPGAVPDPGDEGESDENAAD